MNTKASGHLIDHRDESQPGAYLLLCGCEALVDAGDGTGSRILTDDVAVHVPGRSPVAGTCRGKLEMAALESRLMECSGGTFRIEVIHVLTNGDRGVVLTRYHAERGSRILDMPVVHVWTLRDGRLSGLRVYPGDQHVMDDFWP